MLREASQARRFPQSGCGGSHIPAAKFALATEEESLYSATPMGDLTVREMDGDDTRFR